MCGFACIWQRVCRKRIDEEGLFQEAIIEKKGIRMKKIAVLGSTGSIGTQTLDIVRQNDDLEVAALAAGSNVELMEKQIREFSPRIAVMWSEKACKDLRARVADLDVKDRKSVV